MKKIIVLFVLISCLTGCSNRDRISTTQTIPSLTIIPTTQIPTITPTQSKEITNFGNDPINKKIEEAADQYIEYGSIPRMAMYDIAFPKDQEEFEKLKGFAVLRIVAISQIKDELPPKQVYVMMDEIYYPLTLIGDWQSTVPNTYLSNKVFGAYRWDGFYFLPIYYYLYGSTLELDFAKNRDGFTISDFSDPFPLSDLNLIITEPDEISPDILPIFEFISREYPDTLIH